MFGQQFIDVKNEEKTKKFVILFSGKNIPLDQDPYLF